MGLFKKKQNKNKLTVSFILYNLSLHEVTRFRTTHKKSMITKLLI